MIMNQRVYPVVLFAILGSYFYGINGLVFGSILGYVVGVILPWRL